MTERERAAQWLEEHRELVAAPGACQLCLGPSMAGGEQFVFANERVLVRLCSTCWKGRHEEAVALAERARSAAPPQASPPSGTETPATPRISTSFEARALWSVLVAHAEAVESLDELRAAVEKGDGAAVLSRLGTTVKLLRKARDTYLAATGGTLGASSIHVLHQAASAMLERVSGSALSALDVAELATVRDASWGLLKELGAAFSGLKDAEDREVRAFVRTRLAELHGAPVPDVEDKESRAT